MIGTLRQVDPPIESTYDNVIAYSEDVAAYVEFAPALVERTLLVVYRPLVAFDNDGLHVTGYTDRPLDWTENSPDGYQKVHVVFTPLRPATPAERCAEDEL